VDLIDDCANRISKNAMYNTVSRQPDVHPEPDDPTNSVTATSQGNNQNPNTSAHIGTANLASPVIKPMYQATTLSDKFWRTFG